MMPLTQLVRRSGCFSILLVGGLLAILTGCADPEFQRASQHRVARIDRYAQSFVDREHEADPRLARTQQRIEGLQRYHEARLEVQRQYYPDRHDREVRRWPGRLQRHQSIIDARLRGKPEEIPDTVARLFY